MNSKLFLKLIFLGFTTVVLSTFYSCNKKEDPIAFKGYVVDVNNKKVADARVEVFKTAEDWMTGHNVVTTLVTDLAGYFESEPTFEAGEYYIFIEKYDSSNWEIRKVEQGIFPKINVPEDSDLNHTIEFNNMSAMTATSWNLTNVLREYTKPGATAKEWQSIWSGINNCKRDNKLVFNKDLTMVFSEGTTICSNGVRKIEGTFVPPLIFNPLGCEELPFTKIGVKEFPYSGWPEMESKNAKMYLSCDNSVGQSFILYTQPDGLQVLEVYTRFR